MQQIRCFRLLILILNAVIGLSSALVAQNAVVNGGFETADAWTVYVGGSDANPVEYTFPFTGDKPSLGSGDACLHFYGEILSGGSWINGLIWQEVNLVGGQTYVLDAAWKYLDGNVDAGSWFQFYVSQEEPVDGQDWTPVGSSHSDRMYGFNSWSGCSGLDIDGTFMDDSCDPNYTALYRAPGDAGAPSSAFMGLKTGAGWGGNYFEILVDDISFRPNLLKNGDFEDADGWNVTATGAANALQTTFAVGGENGPALGNNKYLEIKGGGGKCEGVLWQKVDLIGGAEYQFNGGFRHLGGNVDQGFWCEAIISTQAPVEGQEWNDQVIAGFNSTKGCSGLGLNWTFRVGGCEGYGKYTAPGSVGEPVTAYLGIKIGCAPECSGFEVTLDDLSLVRVSESGTMVAQSGVPPSAFSLLQNYPNPFNPTTEIRYSLNERSNVKLTVYDVVGHLLATPVDEVKEPGTYKLSFKGENLSSGIYLYRMEAQGRTITKRMLLMK